MSAEAKLMDRTMDVLVEAIVSPLQTARRPEFELALEDVFVGLRGYWTAAYDVEEVELADGTFVDRACIRFIEFESDTWHLKFKPAEIDGITMQLIQELCDDEVSCMGQP